MTLTFVDTRHAPGPGAHWEHGIAGHRERHAKWSNQQTVAAGRRTVLHLWLHNGA